MRWSYCDTYFFNLYKIFKVHQFSLDFLFAGYRKFVVIHFVLMNGVYQLVITAYWEKVNTKAFFSLDIGIGVGVLI